MEPNSQGLPRFESNLTHNHSVKVDSGKRCLLSVKEETCMRRFRTWCSFMDG